MTRSLFARGPRSATVAGVLAAGFGFAVLTLSRRGLSADALAWALVQLGLAGIAAYDLITRRIRNLVTVPGALLAILLRTILEPGKLLEVLVAGVIVFLAFLALALVLQGGSGMGDAKLAGMLGFMLGSAVVPALLIGTVAGGILGAAVLARSRSKRTTIAYGPYLALGAAIAIVAFDPPPLV